MQQQKFRWSRVYESSEEELTSFLQARNITAQRLMAVDAVDGPYPLLSEIPMTIWCAEGSLSVKDGRIGVSLQPGDALRIEAGTSCELQPGISGYVCYLSA